jgi:hypothetical protein
MLRVRQLELGSLGSEVVLYTERERGLSNPKDQVQVGQQCTYIFKR